MGEKGLGIGLGALFGDDVMDVSSNDFDYLPISKVEPRADQPRYVFDEEALEELANSIAEHGIIQPLTVRELGGGFYQIIAGERRWRAARIAGLNEVPARIIQADDKKAMELALVENLQREDLNPTEEAKGYKLLMTEYGLTQEETAQRVGKSRPAVANSLRLLSLPERVLVMLENGDISTGAARALLALESSALILEVAEKVSQDKMSVRDVEKLVKMLKQKGKKEEKKPREDAIYYEEAQRKLSGAMSRKVKISRGSGTRGKIEIEYYDLDDFERLFSALSDIDALKGEK